MFWCHRFDQSLLDIVVRNHFLNFKLENKTISRCIILSSFLNSKYDKSKFTHEPDEKIINLNRSARKDFLLELQDKYNVSSDDATDFLISNFDEYYIQIHI